MRLRAHLIAHQPDCVLAQTDGAGAAIEELSEMVLDRLGRTQGYEVNQDHILCPDGRSVPSEPSLATLGQLVQEDLCLLEKQGGEYVLTAAVLCFPSGWTLSEKIGHPMIRIHAPVDSYDDDAAQRVGRMMKGLRPGQPIQRWNGNHKSEARLFSPETEAAHHRPRPAQTPLYYRSERQTLVRLPESGAILFSIHSFLWRLDDLRDTLPAK